MSNILKTILLLLLGFFIVPSLPKEAAARQQTLTCMTWMPFIQVNPVIRRTQYVRDVSSANLTKMQQGTMQPGYSYVGGTGGGRIGLETEIKYEFKTLGDQACMSIKSIKGIYYAEPVIHIASDFKRGSCEYAAVLEHEKKHIKVMRDFHRKYDFKVKQEIRNIANYYQSKGPIPRERMEQQQAYVQGQIEKHINEYNAHIMQELRERQEAVDSPEEYARVQAKCRGWGRVKIH